MRVVSVWSPTFGCFQRLIRSRSSHPWQLKRMKRIDDEISGHQPGMTASNFDLPSILPVSLPLKPPDSLQKFVV
jgi:hypothetical protein